MEHKKIVMGWKEFQIPEVLPRLFDVVLDTDFILTITGPRRAGKTYFCFQIIQKLIRQGISKENIVYINFEDNNLLGATADDLDNILESFMELSNPDKKQNIYLFFDEIQIVKDWDAWARKIYDIRKDIKLVLTGSSSKLLSREISTKLRGRVINKEILPLSFKEILNWSKVSYNPKTMAYSKERLLIKKLFSDYIIEGGYPTLFVNKNISKKEILQNYYDSIIFKDIVERYKIEDIKKLKSIAQLLFQSVSNEMSYNKLANKMKSVGFKISKNTIIEYISYFEDAYLFFQNIKYEYSMAMQMGSIKKVYCIDNGLLNSVSFKFSDDKGKLLENAAFIELKRRGKEIYYYRKDRECDFLIKEKDRIVDAIQVCEGITEDNEKREFGGLLEAMEVYGLKEGTILTLDKEDKKEIEGKTIKIIPMWVWLLTP